MNIANPDNYNIFRECLCESIVSQVRSRDRQPAGRSGGGRKRSHRSTSKDSEIAPVDDAEDLAEFIDVHQRPSTAFQIIAKSSEQYISSELFSALPPHLQSLSFEAVRNDEQLATQVTDPLPSDTTSLLVGNVSPTIVDSLSTYQIVEPESLFNLLVPVYQEYVNAATATPPQHDPTKRAGACEICERDWVPLTYHHLIPRQVHAKVLKRKWHEEWQLNSVAWLCRACHSFVHQIAGNEDLARHWWSVELLISREDVQDWAKWVRRLRWKAR